MTKYSIASEIYDLLNKQGVCAYTSDFDDRLLELTDGILAYLKDRLRDDSDLTLHGVRVHQTTLGTPEDYIVCHPYVVRDLLMSPTIRFGTDIVLNKQS